MRFGLSHSDAGEASRLGAVVDRLRSQNNLETILVGKVACTTVLGSNLNYSDIENASVVWEFLKGRSLPGLMALDRVCFQNRLNFYCLPCLPFCSSLLLMTD